MFPFERFTDRAKKVLTLAQEEAERSRHSYIGTEHLLLGLLREGEGVAAIALDNLGVEIRTVRKTIESVLGRNERVIIQQIIPTSRVKKVIEISFEEARRMGHNYVGTEHLLLGLLIEGEGIAAHVLEDLGATLEKIRPEIQSLLQSGEAATEPPSRRGPSRARNLPIEASRLMEPPLRRGPSRTLNPPLDRSKLGEETAALIRLATLVAAVEESASVELRHVERVLSSGDGRKLVDLAAQLDRLAAAKHDAIAAQDYEAAAQHRDEEKKLAEAYRAAETAWLESLRGDAGGEGGGEGGAPG